MITNPEEEVLELASRIEPVDESSAQAARERHSRLTKPLF